MVYHLLANAILLLHLGFILFVACGGFMVLRRPRLAWLHLPAVLWGVWIEYAGWICPLTPLENHLRFMAHEASYTGDFIGHYLTAFIYPHGLTRTMQIVLGSLALILNAALYSQLWRRAK